MRPTPSTAVYIRKRYRSRASTTPEDPGLDGGKLRSMVAHGEVCDGRSTPGEIRLSPPRSQS